MKQTCISHQHSKRAGLQNLCENAWIPAFAGMTSQMNALIPSPDLNPYLQRRHSREGGNPRCNISRIFAMSRSLLMLAFSMALLGSPCFAKDTVPDGHSTRIGDVATVEGIRQNALVGYGLVVGLNRTGDSQQTLFSTQSVANALRKLGVQVSGSLIQTRNVASVFVTAELPPFTRPGEQIDVNVASIGDAKSLQGGVLMMTPLDGPDGRVYAVAQGPLILGGFTAGSGRANSVQENHPTTARIPGGASVEQDTSIDLSRMHTISLLLREPDFTTAEDTASAINQSLGKSIANAIDSRRVDVNVAASGEDVPRLMATIENISIKVQEPARVVVNERTGTVVLGKDVTLGAASVMHGNLVVQITTVFKVSQPGPLSNGQTVVVPQTTVQATEAAARRVELREGATVDELVNGLLAIGATPRDIAAILEALKAAGSLQAEVEVI
jgi:flagellar P-ring protein FlgI